MPVAGNLRGLTGHVVNFVVDIISKHSIIYALDTWLNATPNTLWTELLQEAIMLTPNILYTIILESG